MATDLDHRDAVAYCASKHVAEGVPFKRIAGLEILVEHVVALMPAKPLELGRMHALVHPGRHGAAFKAVPGDHGSIVAGRGSAALNDPRDRTAVERLRADDGGGQGAIALTPRGRPGTSHQKSCRAEMLARRKAALDPA